MNFLDQLKSAANQEQNLDWANLCYYWKKNEQLTQAPEKEKRIIFMGDSITEEWGRLYPEFFQSSGFINRGIGGQTTPQMLLRFKQDVIKLNPQSVFLLAGTNDIAGNTGPSNIDMITNNIFSMAELAASYDIKMIISSVLPVYKYPWAQHIVNVPETIASINQKLKEFTKINDILYMDYYTVMVDEKRGLKNEYTTDGVHLNIKGYEVMSELASGILNKEDLVI